MLLDLLVPSMDTCLNDFPETTEELLAQQGFILILQTKKVLCIRQNGRQTTS